MAAVPRLPSLLARVWQWAWPGCFLEAHPDPDNAKCDGPCALPLDQLEPFLTQLSQLDALVKGFDPLTIR